MNIYREIYFYITTLLVFFVATSAHGNSILPEMLVSEPAGPDIEYQITQDSLLTDEGTEKSDIELLDWSQELVSDYVESLNDGVDSFFMGAFFDDELIEDESSGSNGRLFFTSRRVEGEDVDYQAGINLKIILPHTRDRFKLLVETDENEEGGAETNVLGTTENVTYSTAIRVELRDGKRWKTSLDNGVRWSGEPVYFSRIRSRRTDYFEEWRTRILQSIYWRTDVEWGAKLDMNALRPIDFTRHFNLGFKADYNLNDDMAELQSSASIFDELSHRSAMLYQVAAFGDTESITKINDVVLSVSYRRKIYKSFVFAEIVPEIGFPRDLNYDATPALNFTLEMIIGAH
jgi:hypothetical protein